MSPTPWPPRELRQCQLLLKAARELADQWSALGKGDGVHGTALRTALGLTEQTDSTKESR